MPGSEIKRGASLCSKQGLRAGQATDQGGRSPPLPTRSSPRPRCSGVRRAEQGAVLGSTRMRGCIPAGRSPLGASPSSRRLPSPGAPSRCAPPRLRDPLLPDLGGPRSAPSRYSSKGSPRVGGQATGDRRRGKAESRRLPALEAEVLSSTEGRLPSQALPRLPRAGQKSALRRNGEVVFNGFNVSEFRCVSGCRIFTAL